MELSLESASEMTYTVSGGALNSTQTKPNVDVSYMIFSLYLENVW